LPRRGDGVLGAKRRRDAARAGQYTAAAGNGGTSEPPAKRLAVEPSTAAHAAERARLEAGSKATAAGVAHAYACLSPGRSLGSAGKLASVPGSVAAEPPAARAAASPAPMGLAGIGHGENHGDANAYVEDDDCGIEEVFSDVEHQ
jgi:hypothetical protein